MMTPEKAPANNEASFVEDAPSTPNDVSLDAYNDEDVVDIENQQNDSNAASSANINNTVNDSMTSENCKIINESDQQHTPCPDPEGANTQDMEDVMLIPDSPNLTPVKLDAELKENVTFMSSPTNSQDVRQDDEEETRPLSRRQQRMRVLKCYGLVAIVVLICAIGIPLGAVMIFKNKNEETTFSGITSDGNPTMPVEDTKPPVVLEETTKPVVTTETAVVAEEEDDDDDDDTTLPVQEEIDTEAPAVVVAEPWDVVTDAPVPVDTNVTDPLIEKNVTSEAAPVIDEEQETDSLPVIDEEEEATDAPLVVDEDKEEETDAPTEKEVVDTDAPTMGPTVSPTAKGTRAPGPDRSPIYFELVNVTSPAVLQDVSSPQALSYLWLVEQDETLPVPTGRKLLQRYVLVLMDHVLHDPVRPVLSQASLDECEWTGVVCDEDTGDVLEVNWGRQNMNGQLVPEMRHLDKLERLDLSENELVGSLDFLYETKSLREIYLNDNQFSGTLSEQIGLIGNLEKLYLGHNELTGQIPISLRSPVGEAKPLSKCNRTFYSCLLSTCSSANPFISNPPLTISTCLCFI